MKTYFPGRSKKSINGFWLKKILRRALKGETPIFKRLSSSTTNASLASVAAMSYEYYAESQLHSHYENGENIHPNSHIEAPRHKVLNQWSTKLPLGESQPASETLPACNQETKPDQREQGQLRGPPDMSMGRRYAMSIAGSEKQLNDVPPALPPPPFPLGNPAHQHPHHPSDMLKSRRVFGSLASSSRNYGSLKSSFDDRPNYTRRDHDHVDEGYASMSTDRYFPHRSIGTAIGPLLLWGPFSY
jgi:hypothetical protein